VFEVLLHRAMKQHLEPKNEGPPPKKGRLRPWCLRCSFIAATHATRLTRGAMKEHLEPKNEGPKTKRIYIFRPSCLRCSFIVATRATRLTRGHPINVNVSENSAPLMALSSGLLADRSGHVLTSTSHGLRAESGMCG